MEQDLSDTLHTVVLTRLDNETVREGVAEALSRLGGLPIDRVLRRLDTLPWTLLKNANRSKTLRLLTVLERFEVQVDVIPPLAGHESKPAETFERLPGTRQQAEEIPSDPAPRLTPMAPTETPPESQNAGPTGKGAPPLHGGSIESGWSPPPDSVSVARVSIDPLALDGVLDPAFRLEHHDSWLSAIVLVPWNILSGTLQALSETLDRSFDICRIHFWRLFAIVGVPWAIVAGVALIGMLAIFLLSFAVQSLLDLPLWVLVVGVIVLIPAGVVGSVLLFLLPHAALIYAVSELYLGRNISFVSVYRFALSRLVRYGVTAYLMVFVTFGLFIASTIAALVVLVPLTIGLSISGPMQSVLGVIVVAVLTTTAFVLPLAYCLPRLLLFDKVVMIEDHAYGDALRRSWNLLSGRAGKQWYTSYYWLFGMLLLVLIPLQWGIYFLFEGPSLLLAYLMPGPKFIGTYVGQVLSTLGSLLAQLYTGVATVLFYYCIRSRKEGHDLLVLAETDREHQGE